MQPTWNPTPGQIALIEVSGSPDLCLTGVVLSASAEGVRVDLGASPPLPDASREVVASFFQADALYRAKAKAAMGGDHLLVLDIFEVDRVQRRSAARAHVCLPVSLAAFDGPGEFTSVVGTTVDVGSGGCCVRTARPFPPGSDPTVTIDLDQGHAVSVAGQVVHTEARPDGWEYRIAFGEMDEAGAKLLADIAR